MESKKQPKKYFVMEGIVNAPRKNKTKKVVNEAPKQNDNNSIETIPDDRRTEQAIEDIVISDSNELLAVEDKNLERIVTTKKNNKVKKILLNKWIYLTLALILILIFAIPYTRYKILGLFIKNSYHVEVVDKESKLGISGVEVKIGNYDIKTDSNGFGSINLPLGSYQATYSKQYYTTVNSKAFIGLSPSKINIVSLDSKGRLISINVVNKLNKQPISKATVNIIGSDYVTDKDGKVNLRLSSGSESYQAQVKASGYNDTTATIVVGISNKQNVITMIPSGSLVYLVNQSNKLNLVKSNLDGTNPINLVVGTGHEDPANTKIYLSQDQKYVMLYANRGGNQNQLYFLNITTPTLNEIEDPSALINPIGWIGDTFMYDTINPAANNSVAGKEKIKSYNTNSNQSSVLDQNAVNKNADTYEYQGFSNFNIVAGQLVYVTTWSLSGNYSLASSNDTIRGVNLNTNKTQDYYTFSALTSNDIFSKQYSPIAVYFSILNIQTNQTQYLSYKNEAVTPINIDKATFGKSYPNYYLQIGNGHSIWMDGSNIMIGDASGNNSKILGYSGYTFYGWYNSDYILLKKGSSLYIATLNPGATYYVADIYSN